MVKCSEAGLSPQRLSLSQSFSISLYLSGFSSVCKAIRCLGFDPSLNFEYNTLICISFILFFFSVSLNSFSISSFISSVVSVCDLFRSHSKYSLSLYLSIYLSLSFCLCFSLSLSASLSLSPSLSPSPEFRP